MGLPLRKYEPMVIPTKQYDVFSQYVIVYPGQTIDWMCESQVPSASVQASGSWALTQSSYSGITPSTPQPALVSSNAVAGSSGVFTSTPQGPNSPQNVIVAGWWGGVYEDPTLAAGQYIIWINDSATKYVITPASTGWPLPSRNIIVQPYSLTIIRANPGAPVGSYEESVLPSFKDTNPVIKITS